MVTPLIAKFDLPPDRLLQFNTHASFFRNVSPSPNPNQEAREESDNNSSKNRYDALGSFGFLPGLGTKGPKNFFQFPYRWGFFDDDLCQILSLYRFCPAIYAILPDYVVKLVGQKIKNLHR